MGANKVKVLTVQFDVTGLPQEAIDTLLLSAVVQGEEILTNSGAEYDADVLNTSVREVDADDM